MEMAGTVAMVAMVAMEDLELLPIKQW